MPDAGVGGAHGLQKLAVQIGVGAFEDRQPLLALRQYGFEAEGLFVFPPGGSFPILGPRQGGAEAIRRLLGHGAGAQLPPP